MANIIDTIAADLKTVWGELEGDVEAGAEALWSLFGPIIKGIPATVASDVKAALSAFLSDPAVAGGSIEDIEQAFLEHAESLGTELWGVVKSLSGPFLQGMIIGVKAL